jgi:hypothetical protein
MEEPKIITKEERAARKAKRLGLGDAVASVATPIARVLHLSCIDPATNQLRPESPCAKRKANWNNAVPNLNPFTSKPCK